MRWRQKHQPNCLADYVCSDKRRSLIRNWIDEGDCPHLLFAGPYGTGKSCLANLLGKELDAEPIKLNVADKRGIEILRGIERQLNHLPLSGKKVKILILDEADNLTRDFQSALRGYIDRYEKTNRFILTANELGKIDGAIRDRCTLLEFDEPPKPEMAKRALRILKLEDIEFELEDVTRIVNESYPSIRRMIDNLQRFSINGKLEIDQQNTT